MQKYEKQLNNGFNNGCHNISICLIARNKAKKIKKRKSTKHIMAFLFVSFRLFCYLCSHIT